MTPDQQTRETLEIGRQHGQSHLAWQRAQVRRFGLPLALATAEGKEDRWNPGFNAVSLAREMGKREREARNA